LANFIVRLTQRAEKIAEAAGNLRGKFSGAVGAHSALALKWPNDPASVEELVLTRLRLKPGQNSVSTQVIQPEYVTDYGHALVSTFGVIAHIADDYRQLMRSEIEEVRERLDTYQVGSSTMPHKINPKNFENVKSLWKAFMPRMTTLYMDQISEHQRDLTNSASMRFFNELVAATYYSTYRLEDAIKKTEVNLSALKRNLEDSYRWIIAEPLYISYALAGHPDPYYAFRKFVLESREQNKDIRSLIESDSEAKAIWARIPKERRDIILSPERYVGDAKERTHIACDDAELSWSSPQLSGLLLEGPSERELIVGT
jgi:adenylosuccinate lyase